MARTHKLMERTYCGVRFALMLDNRHAKTGPLPVCVRVTYDYRQKYFRHGDSVTEDDFIKSAKANKGALYEGRKGWEAFFDRVYNSARKDIDEGVFSISSFSVRAGDVSDVTLNSLYRERMDEIAESGKVNTWELYRTVLNRIEERFGTVRITDVGTDFLRRFAKSLEGLSKTTQSIYLRNLRAVCNYAIYKGAMKQEAYPFTKNRYDSGRVRIPNGGSRKDSYLGIDDMRRLYRYEGPFRTEVSLFLFSYLANGANLTDIARMRFDGHYWRSGGKELRYIRRKTKDTVSEETEILIPVTEWLKNVMGRLGVEESRNGLLFPFLLDNCNGTRSEAMRLDTWSKRIGKALGSVCAELGIEGRVTMTWARHSFKTNLIRLKVPDWYCEQAMGHVDRSVGAHYVGMFTTEDRMEYNGMLL